MVGELAPECEVCVYPKLEVGKTVPQELKEPRTKEPPALGMLGYLDLLTIGRLTFMDHAENLSLEAHLSPASLSGDSGKVPD